MDQRIKHGMGRRSGRPPEYVVWCKMRQRCDSEADPSYPDYGGRGIKVCERWYDFAAFFADMGSRPSRRHSLERVNNDAGYSPDNCVWATASEQALNRRPRALSATCGKGHPLSGDNLYIRPDGKRACMECKRAALRACRERKLAHVD